MRLNKLIPPLTSSIGVWLMTVSAGICSGQELPQFINASTINDNYFALAIRPETNGWLTLQCSSDLQTWSDVACIATTNDSTLYVDEGNARLGNRFYRLRMPGTSVAEAQLRWSVHGITGYRFQLQRVSSTQAPYVMTGSVTVTNGQKTVTNATSDGEPVSQPDPADFPSVEELFAALESAQEAGCRQVCATYDATLGFPLRCFIDQRTVGYPRSAEGNSLEYRITGMEFWGGARASVPVLQPKVPR